MPKIVLDEITSGYNLQKINNNLQRIADELNNKVLYRDNPLDQANELQNDIDLNSNNILNAGELQVREININGIDFTEVAQQTKVNADAAKAAADSALSSLNQIKALITFHDLAYAYDINIFEKNPSEIFNVTIPRAFIETPSSFTDWAVNVVEGNDFRAELHKVNSTQDIVVGVIELVGEEYIWSSITDHSLTPEDRLECRVTEGTATSIAITSRYNITNWDV